MKKLLLSSILCLMLIFSPLCLTACTNGVEDHRITVTFSNGQNGTATGSGIFKTNSSVTIKASPKNGHTFLGWVKNDLIISRENIYTFIANKQTEGKYTAFFSTEELEFFKIDEINYEISGLDLNQQGLELNYITLIDIKYGITSELLKNFGKITEQEMSNTGNFQTTDFKFDERIFYITKLYYFSIELNYEYFNFETETLFTGVINSDFNINFDLLKMGTVYENITTYVGDNYTLTQTFEEKNFYTIEVSDFKLQNHNLWNEEATHNLSFKFIYPFDIEIEEIE